MHRLIFVELHAWIGIESAGINNARPAVQSAGCNRSAYCDLDSIFTKSHIVPFRSGEYLVSYVITILCAKQHHVGIITLHPCPRPGHECRVQSVICVMET